MEASLTTLGYAVGIATLAWIGDRWLRSYIDSQKRKQLETEIRAIADDLTTDPKGLSLRDAIDLLEIKLIHELVIELRKMPPGSRSLQRAIEITRDTNYGRAA
ncbi:hypothetical protein GCM10025793_08840 [Lysobacter lycopersici]